MEICWFSLVSINVRNPALYLTKMRTHYQNNPPNKQQGIEEMPKTLGDLYVRYGELHYSARKHNVWPILIGVCLGFLLLLGIALLFFWQDWKAETAVDKANVHHIQQRKLNPRPQNKPFFMPLFLAQHSATRKPTSSTTVQTPTRSMSYSLIRIFP